MYTVVRLDGPGNGRTTKLSTTIRARSKVDAIEKCIGSRVTPITPHNTFYYEDKDETIYFAYRTAKENQ